MGIQHSSAPTTDPLERGHFSDGHTNFTVWASSQNAPDSFQVSADGNRADLVLIVSGLNSGNLHATWGQGWRTFNPDWTVWIEDAAVKVFYTGNHIDHRQDPGPGLVPLNVRQCNG